MPTYPEGYPSELFTADVSTFECELCHCVVRDPVEHSGCNQLFCSDCIRVALSSMKPSACPHCMSSAAIMDFRRINRLLRQMLDAKEMRCVHYPECDHVCTLGSMEKHLTQCVFQTVNCKYSGCDEQLLRKDVGEHEASCSRRTQPCGFCDSDMLVSAMEWHIQNNCQRAPVVCKFCDLQLPRNEMSKHLAETCDKQPVKCVIDGCSHVMPKNEVQGHVDANLSGHLTQIQQQMWDMNKTIAELKDEMAALRLALVQKDEAIAEMRSQLLQQQQQQQQKQSSIGSKGFSVKRAQPLQFQTTNGFGFGRPAAYASAEGAQTLSFGGAGNPFAHTSQPQAQTNPPNASTPAPGFRF